MQEGTGPQPNLVNLNETELYLEEPWQDLRGLDVYDTNNDQIGSVEDVYVDREQREARLLVVSAGGLLRVGKVLPGAGSGGKARLGRRASNGRAS